MHPKDKVLLAFALALCSMSFLTINLLGGLLMNAIYCGLVMCAAIVYVIRFIGIVTLPQALRRRLG